MPTLEPFVPAGRTLGSYWDRPRSDVIYAASRCGMGGRVVDVGCGTGWVGAALLDAGLASDVTGVEFNVAAVKQAKIRLTSVIHGDALEYFSRDDVQFFDGAILADVLEHQVSPDELLLKVVTLLRPGATIIISLPNVRHFRVLTGLAFRGDWTYVDEGILDRTHLRFFTLKTALELAKCAGVQLEFVLGVMTDRGRLISRILPRLAPFFSTQLVLGCRRA